MVQTLNLILLTAAELHELRDLLKDSLQRSASPEKKEVFVTLFHCWCHNSVATFSFCLLAQAYDEAFALIKKFSERDVTVGFLMQVDKLVQLLESPVFIHLRLQLLDVDAKYHTPLLKSLYGLLMLLPQSDAFQALNDRLTTVCSLKEHMGIIEESSPLLEAEVKDDSMDHTQGTMLESNKLLKRFENISEMHKCARENDEYK
eukprot:CAMPEP_0116035392 /NCGR_PEP_ID=MMETSP0321-20121206/20336_1 /TAXON_ID=163516 /ORGANISM="Leptocylindrus danicus var. danicus, Strain B650" /LENGTH=202 /DNA_ID=CAMNT_0003512207 /DNA_START=35 /DNA_END=643 /DNA_ORIENTATION=+